MSGEFQSRMQSLRVPVLKLQRVEGIYPSVLRESTIRIDLGSSERNEVIHVQLEGVSDITEEENRELTSLLTDPRTEHGHDFKSVLVLQNCVGLIKNEPDSGSEACVITLDEGTEETNIKIEDLVDIKEENPEPIKFPPIKTEPENCGLIRDELDSGSEACVTALDDGTEEGNIEVEESEDIREENPGAKTFPPINTEPEGTWNRQHQVHTGEHRYSCNVCSKAFNCKGDLTRHKCSHAGERRYCCDVCSKLFTKKSKFIKHKRLHSGERPYCCDVCKKTFIRKGSMVKHQRIHSCDHPYCCDVCSKMFTQKSKLIKHKRLHSGERLYCCDVCKKTFTRKGSMVKHQRIHNCDHPYCCDVCSKVFMSKNGLTNHKHVHSGERPVGSDVRNKTFNLKSTHTRRKYIYSFGRPYCCDICHKTFNRMCQIVDHQLTHSSDHAYCCDVCSKVFNIESDLIKHKRIHIGESQSDCDECKNDLQFHLYPMNAPSPFKAATTKGTKTFKCPIHSCTVKAYN